MSLTHLQNNISLYSAQEEFAKSELEDPSKVANEIATEKLKFSKLKFQYLEQETRDKFLRIILSNTPIQITEDDLSKIRDESGQLKSDLKSLKTQLNEKQAEIDTASEDFLRKDASFKDKYDIANQLIAEIDAMDKEYHKLVADLDADLVEDVGSLAVENVTELDGVKAHQDEQLAQQQSLLNQLSNEHKLKEQLAESQEVNLAKASQQLSDITVDSSQQPTRNNSTNTLGKWINEVNRLLGQFLDSRHQLVVEDDIEISVDQHKIVLDREKFTVKSTTTALDTGRFDGAGLEEKLELLYQVLAPQPGTSHDHMG